MAYKMHEAKLTITMLQIFIGKLSSKTDCQLSSHRSTLLLEIFLCSSAVFKLF